jgi:hypothetical protein
MAVTQLPSQPAPAHCSAQLIFPKPYTPLANIWGKHSFSFSHKIFRCFMNTAPVQLIPFSLHLLRVSTNSEQRGLKELE